MARDVRELKVFQRAYVLALEVHRATQAWSKAEQYGGMADQLRRATKSVCALLAEGSGRQQASGAEFRRYVMMALGSADEAAVWCMFAGDLGLAVPGQAQAWQAECREVARMLQGLLKHLSGL